VNYSRFPLIEQLLLIKYLSMMQTIAEGSEGPKPRSDVAGFESDDDQVQERWHRDRFGRDNNQSMTKAVENQKNLEEALLKQGFSQVRAAKIAFYMTWCDGQFQECDLIVKKLPRPSNPALQEEIILGLATETVQGPLGRAIGDDGDQDETGDKDSDGDENEAPSIIGGRQSWRCSL
jgi:hypothetical protein